MRQIHLLAVVALAATVLVGWLIFSDDPGQAAAAQGLASGEDAPAAVVPPHPLGASESSEGVARNATSLAVLASGAAAVDEPPSGERGLELIAVVGAARRRLAEVEMWWWEEPDGVEPKGYESLDELLQRGKFEAVLSKRATRLVADENGRFQAPSPTARGQAIAIAPGWFGRESVGATTADPCLIELEADTELAARVVDGSGAPVAGVTVALRQIWGGQFLYDHGRAETGPDGVAKLRHYRQLIGGDWDFDGRYCIAIAEPLGQEVAKHIDITRPPTELVELVLPAVGVVEVELVGADPDTWVELETPSPDTEFAKDSERFHDGRRRPDGGKVRFEFVGLGRDVIVWTGVRHRAKAHEEERCRGPRFAGQMVRVKLRVESARLRLAGRLVDESGKVFAGARLGVVLREPGRELGSEDDGWAEHIEGRSDASGRFEVEFSRGAVNGGSLDFDVRDAMNAVLARGKRPITAVGAGEALELGDVHVQGVPVHATGLVQDARGAPVPRALVKVFQARDRQRGNGSVTRSWSHVWQANAWSDDRGRFSIRTSEKDWLLALRAQTPDARSAPLEIRAGDSDIVLVLDQDGELSGRLLLAAAGTPTDYLNVEVSRAAGEPVALELPEYRGHVVDSGGEFAVRGLAPGLYDVRVRLQGREDPLASVSAVRVSAGAGPRDPRLDPLDLRNVGDFVELVVFDADGRIPEDIVACQPAGGAGTEFRNSWNPGGRLLLDRRDPPLWVTAEHCRLELVDPAAVGRELRLRRASTVRIVLEEGLPLPGDEVRMRVSLHGIGEPEGLRECVEDTLTFDSSRAAQGEVRRVGALAAVVWLRGEGSASLPAEFVGGNTVTDSPAVQTLTIRYSREAFDAALAETRE
jgi:hypothetical protein